MNMIAKIKRTGEVINVRQVCDVSGNVFYEEVGLEPYDTKYFPYYENELEFLNNG